MGNKTRQDTSFFNKKQEKQGKNWGKMGENGGKTLKNRGGGKNRKKQKITRNTETRF